MNAPTTTEVMRALIGKTLTDVRESGAGILLTFSDGTVVLWQR